MTCVDDYEIKSPYRWEIIRENKYILGLMFWYQDLQLSKLNAPTTYTWCKPWSRHAFFTYTSHWGRLPYGKKWIETWLDETKTSIDNVYFEP